MDAPVHEVIEKVPAKAEAVEPAAVETSTPDAPKEQPVKTYSQSEVDEITKKVKENARRKRDEARQEAAALRRLLLEHGQQPQRAEQQPQATRQTDEPQVPQREQYADDQAYWLAVIDYRADVKAKEHIERQTKTAAEQHARQGQEQLERVFSTNQEKARAKYEDYDDVVYNPSLPTLHPAVIQTLKSLENGADIAYAIAKNPEEAMRLARLHPILALKELGKIEAKLETPAAPAGTPAITPPAAPVAKKQPLPAPIAPVVPKDARPDSNEPSDADDDATWLRKRQKQLREQGRR